MSVSEAYNFRVIDEKTSTSGVISETQLGCLAEEGYVAVINLLPSDSEYAVASEPSLVKELGLGYYYIPVDFNAPSAVDFLEFERVMALLNGKKVLIHCAANYRVSAFYSRYAGKHLGWSQQQMDECIASIWNPQDHPPWPEFVTEDS